uniref:FAD-dependent oxidoreductase n=1 Tax=Pseudonocardia pini TaxID=2758030 RepID=UPI0015F07510
ERTRPLSWEPGSDVALGGLLRERFGHEVAERLVEPLLGGVYAGRVDSLGLRATIPTLAAALDAGAVSLTEAATRATTPPPASPPVSTRESPTLDARVGHPTPASPPVSTRESDTVDARVGQGGPAGLVSAGRPTDPAGSGGPRVSGQTAGAVFGAVRGGYRVLLEALLSASKAELRLGTTVRELARTARGWRLTSGPTTAPEQLEVDAVVLAVPAPAAARLVAGTEAAGPLGEIELASSAVVALAYGDVAGPDTSGVLVAADEPLAIKAATHSSTKWAHVSPDGLLRLRVSMGRFGEVASLQVDDAELVARARRDLETLHGITAAPVDVHVQRWGGGLPQYAVGHGGRVAAIEAATAGLPGLEVVGAALHGVGVPACIGTARLAADRLATELLGADRR